MINKYEIWYKESNPITGKSFYKVVTTNLTKYVAIDLFNTYAINHNYFKRGKLLLIHRTCKPKENEFKVIQEHNFEV